MTYTSGLVKKLHLKLTAKYENKQYVLLNFQ